MIQIIINNSHMLIRIIYLKSVYNSTLNNKAMNYKVTYKIKSSVLLFVHYRPLEY